MIETELIVFRQLVMCLEDAKDKLEGLTRNAHLQAHLDRFDNVLDLAREILAEHGDEPDRTPIVEIEANAIGSMLTPQETERDLIPTKPI